MLRPKDIIDDLAISAPSLRLWSKKFAGLLSPGAQSSQTDAGGIAQRRYTQDDFELFKRVKRFLDAGKTYDETLLALTQQEPPPEAIELPPTHEEPSTDLAVVEPIHPVMQAFEEALRAKDETIAAKDETIAAKIEVIETLHRELTRKDKELETFHAAVAQPAVEAAPVVVQPKFRWKWLGKLLTGETQDVG